MAKKNLQDKLNNQKKQLLEEQEEILKSLEEKPDFESTTDSLRHKDNDFVDIKSDKKNRSKQVMKRVWGIDKDEDEKINKRQKNFKRLVSAIFIIFVVAVLAYTAYNDFFGSNDRNFPDWKDFQALLKTGWIYLVLAILALFANYLCKTLKISIMCKQNTKKWHLKTSLETAIIGCYYDNITPLSVGGQPFQIYHLSKHGVHGGAASSAPIAAFFLNQFCFGILGVIAIAMFYSNTLNIPATLHNAFPPAFLTLAIIGVILALILPTLVILCCLLPKISAKLVHFVIFLGGKLKLVKNPKETTLKTVKNVYQNATCLKALVKRPLVFISTFLLSFGEYFASLTIAYFTLKAFNFNIEGFGGVMGWLQICQLCILLLLSISFIPTPGNSGAADLSFYILFAVGLPMGFAFPAMAIWRILSFYSTIIIGFVFATTKKRKEQKIEKFLQEQQMLLDSEDSFMQDYAINSENEQTVEKE